MTCVLIQQDVNLTSRKGKRKAVDTSVDETRMTSTEPEVRRSQRRNEATAGSSTKPRISNALTSSLSGTTRSRQLQLKKTSASSTSDVLTALHSRIKRVCLVPPQRSRVSPPSKSTLQMSSWRSKPRLPMQSFEVIDLTTEYVRIFFLNLIKVVLFYYIRDVPSTKYRL